VEEEEGGGKEEEVEGEEVEERREQMISHRTIVSRCHFWASQPVSNYIN
jgi:hypothetical protein